MTSLDYECVTQSLVQPFIDSTKSVFSMMLGGDVSLVTDGSLNGTKFDISGIISFSGAIQGSAVISLDKDVALAITETLLGSRPSEIDDDVRDMVGELANMIGGNSKERISNSLINLGLPTVITGRGHQVSFEPGAKVERLFFRSEWGPVAIELGMRSPKT